MNYYVASMGYLGFSDSCYPDCQNFTNNVFESFESAMAFLNNYPFVDNVCTLSTYGYKRISVYSVDEDVKISSFEDVLANYTFCSDVFFAVSELN